MTPIEYNPNGKGIILWLQWKRHGFMKDYFLEVEIILVKDKNTV